MRIGRGRIGRGRRLTDDDPAACLWRPSYVAILGIVLGAGIRRDSRVVHHDVVDVDARRTS